MKGVILRFPHLAEQILQKLDNEGLAKSREVEQFWQKFIDERNYLWLRIVNIPTILVKENTKFNTYLHLTAYCGQIDAFEMILNEDSNKDPKNHWDETPYLFACRKGHMNISAMILKKSAELDIDLNKRDVGDYTAFHLACQFGHLEVAEMILENASRLKLDLNTKNQCGKTAFHICCMEGHSKIAEMIMNYSSKLKIDFNTRVWVIYERPFLSLHALKIRKGSIHI